MATYVNDLRLKEIGTGESSGTWGSETNTNLELIGEALGFGTEAITTNADTHTTTVADGSTDPGRAMYIKYTGTLDSACTITIAPNTMSRMHFIENGTSGSQNIIISQGTGANVTIPAGDVKAVYLDGAGSGAAVTDAFASLNVVDLKVEDDLTVTDDATIGGTLGVTGIVTLTDDLIIGDGKTIGSASDVDAMTIASNGQVTFSQTLIGTALDISGDIDVDGTTNLDVVDIDGALTQDGGAVFNEASADVDFRVESNGQTHALFVDGGLDNIGIGYSAAHTATNKGLVILTGDGNGGVQFNKEDGSYPSSGETLGSIGWKGADSANSNAAAGASIVGIAAEDFSGSAEGTHLAFNLKPTGTGPGSAPTERMRISSQGNLSIGTTAVSASGINLNTGLNYSITEGADSSYANLFRQASSAATVLANGYRHSNNSNAFASSFGSSWAKTAVSLNYGTIRFYTDGAATTSVGTDVTPTERMRINSNGTIGIGTTGGTYILDLLTTGNNGLRVNTGTSSADQLYLGNTGGVSSVGTLTDDDLQVITNGSQRMLFTSSDITVDAAGDIILDADGGNILFKDGAVGTFLDIQQDSSGPELISRVSDADFKIRGNDGGTTITALSFDMSEGGAATFGGTINPDAVINFINAYSATVANGPFVYFSTSGSITVGTDSTAGRNVMSFRNPNGEVGTITTSGTSTAYNTSSDYRLKENVDYTWDATTRLKQLKPARFNFIADSTNTLVDGFLAHEVSNIVPEAITGAKDAVDSDNNAIYQGIDQSKLVPLLVKTIQELEARITALES